MLIDFDPAKDLINQAKHGLSLARARELNWDKRSSGLMSGETRAKFG